MPFAVVPRRIKGIKRFGTWYGGWDVITPLVNQDSVVYSFGIGHDNSFDAEFIQAIGCKVLAYDPTPGLAEYYAKNPQDPKFIFKSVGLANFDGEADMRPLDMESESSSTITARDMVARDSAGLTVPVRTFVTLCKENGHTRVDVLKMDIEGSEFDVIPDILASGIQVDQLLVEFHPSWTGGLEKSRECIQMLKDAGYEIFWISKHHVEYGWVRKGAIL